MTSRAAAFFDRPTSTSREVTAGCFVCRGSEAIWTGGNAQGVAARHHDATGHATWCDVYLQVQYGVEAPDTRQVELEDAIAASALNDTPAAPERRRTVPPGIRPTVTCPASARQHLQATETHHA